jgi:hypothetical protein
MKIAVITRCKNEPYIHEFVAYYLNEGIDTIYIYDDFSSNDCYKNIRPQYLNNIKIIKSDESFKFKGMGFKNSKFFKILHHEVKNYDWVINVDVDEFISSNDDKNIRYHLENTYNNVDCVQIPWVFMAYNDLQNNPPSLLRDITYRWNHDLKHDKSKYRKFRCRSGEIEVKSIYRPSIFSGTNPHTPKIIKDKEYVCVNSVDNRHTKKPIVYFKQLNESKISNSVFLCYHYRFFSKSHIQEKIENSTFYQKFNINDVYFDYPEILELTMKNKAIKYNI